MRQEAQDRAMEAFEEARNITDEKRSSGFRPGEVAEKRDYAGSSGTSQERLNGRKIN